MSDSTSATIVANVVHIGLIAGFRFSTLAMKLTCNEVVLQFYELRTLVNGVQN